MPGYKPIEQPGYIRYLYDGSFSGFFCCVHESVYARELPMAICPAGSAQPSMWPEKQIETNENLAQKVFLSIRKKISPRVSELIENVYFSCMEEKEIFMLRFLQRAFSVGAKITNMLGDADVAPLLRAELHLLRESHLLLGFVRFSDNSGALTATITPKNFVLPYIANHFISRFYKEDFMIYDKTHKAALIYQNQKKQIIHADGLTPPPVTADEQYYRSLWKQFYDTISIAARENPKCRMTHMPKRFWENMVEMQDQF